MIQQQHFKKRVPYSLQQSTLYGNAQIYMYVPCKDGCEPLRPVMVADIDIAISFFFLSST